MLVIFYAIFLIHAALAFTLPSLVRHSTGHSLKRDDICPGKTYSLGDAVKVIDVIDGTDYGYLTGQVHSFPGWTYYGTLSPNRGDSLSGLFACDDPTTTPTLISANNADGGPCTAIGLVSSVQTPRLGNYSALWLAPISSAESKGHSPQAVDVVTDPGDPGGKATYWHEAPVWSKVCRNNICYLTPVWTNQDGSKPQLALTIPTGLRTLDPVIYATADIGQFRATEFNGPSIATWREVYLQLD